MFTEDSYGAGDLFKITVNKHFIDKYPAKDFTVRLYSQQDTYIEDQRSNRVMLHMDGQIPSGFTASDYCGPYCESN
jgi:hypothetical protein